MPVEKITRRIVVAGIAVSAAGVPASLAQTPASVADGASVDVAELNKAGPLGDVFLGNTLAPVTIIEYASMTCTHCASFHASGFKALKEKYIDPGKVRYALREFPLDPLAAAGFMLARCAGEGKFYPVVDLLFTQQKNWAFSQKPVDDLLTTIKQAGFTKESFEACLKDEKMFEGINQVRTRGAEKFGVNSTPTFFINGRIERGLLTPEKLDELLQPLLKQ
jgi:protein-disulfide isomerase